LVENFEVEDGAVFFFAADEKGIMICAEFFVVGRITFSDWDIWDRL
jgi:hypothetical protein